jgi:hypothetical protein
MSRPATIPKGVSMTGLVAFRSSASRRRETIAAARNRSAASA